MGAVWRRFRPALIGSLTLFLAVWSVGGCGPPPQIDVSTYGMAKNFRDNRTAFDEILRRARAENRNVYVYVQAIREGKPVDFSSYSDRNAAFVAEMAKIKAWQLEISPGVSGGERDRFWISLYVDATGLSVSGTCRAYQWVPEDVRGGLDTVQDVDLAEKEGRKRGERSGDVWVELGGGWYIWYDWDD